MDIIKPSEKEDDTKSLVVKVSTWKRLTAKKIENPNDSYDDIINKLLDKEDERK